MATPDWQVSGEYFETCSCDYVCPCIPSNLAARPTKGSCTGAIAFRTPGTMADGNWELGLLVDEKASAAQRDAIASIASGQAGGPMAALAPLVGKLLGVQSAPIRFQKNGLKRSVSVPGLLDQAVDGTPSPVKQGEPLWVDNTLHPGRMRGDALAAAPLPPTVRATSSPQEGRGGSRWPGGVGRRSRSERRPARRRL